MPTRYRDDIVLMETYNSRTRYRPDIFMTIYFHNADVVTISARYLSVILSYLSCEYRHDIGMIMIYGSDDIGTIIVHKYRDDIVGMDVTISCCYRHGAHSKFQMAFPFW